MGNASRADELRAVVLFALGEDLLRRFPSPTVNQDMLKVELVTRARRSVCYQVTNKSENTFEPDLPAFRKRANHVFRHNDIVLVW